MIGDGIPISLRFSTVCCDPHSQRMWHSQESSRYFSGTLLFFWWSGGCWQFDLCPSAFSKFSLKIWKFMIHILLKADLKNYKHCFASLWDECNCAVSWAFSGVAFFGGLEWKLTFSSPVATTEFSKFAGILSAAPSQYHLSGFEAQLEFHHLP